MINNIKAKAKNIQFNKTTIFALSYSLLWLFIERNHIVIF